MIIIIVRMYKYTHLYPKMQAKEYSFSLSQREELGSQECSGERVKKKYIGIRTSSAAMDRQRRMVLFGYRTSILIRFH